MDTQAAKLFSKIILSDKPVRIKLLGDSITHGYGGTGYAQNGENFVTTFRRNKDGYCWARLMADYLGIAVPHKEIRLTIDNYSPKQLLPASFRASEASRRIYALSEHLQSNRCEDPSTRCAWSG